MFTTIYNELKTKEEISLQTLQNTIRLLIKTAYRIAYGSSDNCVVSIEDTSIQIFEIKTVVDEEYSERLEIEIQTAKTINPDCKIGDKLQIQFDSSLLSPLDILKATSEIYRKTNDNEKIFIIQYIQVFLEGFENDYKEIPKSQPSSGSWQSYYESYKPFHHDVTPAEEELDRRYSLGFFDPGPNPFPFSQFDSEDDYGSDSWS